MNNHLITDQLFNSQLRIPRLPIATATAISNRVASNPSLAPQTEDVHAADVTDQAAEAEDVGTQLEVQEDDVANKY